MKKIGKKLISILLIVCLSFSMMTVAAPTASAGVGTIIGKKALELGLRFACKASVELAAQCDNDNALIVVNSVINLLLSDGHGVKTNNIAKMCEDILAELAELEEDVRVYTADISASIQKQNLKVTETQYTYQWKNDVSNVLIDNSVDEAFNAYIKYFIASNLNANKRAEGDISESLRTYWQEHFHDTLTADDYTDESVKQLRNALEKEFVEIYDSTNGLSNKDAAYKNVLIFNKFSKTIDTLTQKFVYDSVVNDKKEYSVLEYAASDAYYGLPYSSQQYEFVNATAKRQIMIVNLLQMALNEYLSMQGEYLSETYGGDWNTSITLKKDGYIDNSSTYDRCKAKYQEIIDNSLQESVNLMESDIRLNTVAYTGNKEDIKLKLSDYMPTQDATKVKLSIDGYASTYDYYNEISETEADNSMELGNTTVKSKKIPSGLTFYRVMSGGKDPKVYYILDPAQFDDTDTLDLNNFREHIKRYGPTGGSDSLYGDLYPVGLDYLNLIKPMSDGTNTYSIPKNTMLTDEFSNLIKVPCFSATSNFSFKEYLSAFLPVSTGGNTYILSSGYSNNFNEGTNTEVKNASINLINTSTALGNDYVIETDSVRVKDIPNNYHNYSAILTNNNDSYIQKIKVTADDKAGSVSSAFIDYNGNAILLNNVTEIKSGENISVKFKLEGESSTFDSLVLVRHNQEDTETVLLDRDDLLNSLEPDNGFYSFDLKMPYSNAEIVIKTKAEDNLDTDDNGNYIIRTYNDLYEMAYRINTGNEKYTTATYILANDIDCEDYTNWVPAGKTSLFHLNKPSLSKDWGFKGTFDGQGHIIKNLNIVSNLGYAQTFGIFGTLSGTVKNLGVENFAYSGGYADSRVGAIAGQVLEGGLITDCYVATADINTNQHTDKGVAGGIAGANYAGTIKNCHAYNVTVTAGRAGGVVGDNYGDGNNSDGTDRPGVIDNCYTTSTVICNRGVAENSKENVSVETFASGEIAYLLNNKVTDGTQIWYQNIDNGLTPDNYPILINNNQNTVYHNNGKDCYTNIQVKTAQSVLTKEDLKVYHRIYDKNGTISNKSKTLNGCGEIDNVNNTITIYTLGFVGRVGILNKQGAEDVSGYMTLKGYEPLDKTSAEILHNKESEEDIYVDKNKCIFIKTGVDTSELTLVYDQVDTADTEYQPTEYKLVVKVLNLDNLMSIGTPSRGETVQEVITPSVEDETTPTEESTKPSTSKPTTTDKETTKPTNNTQNNSQKGTVQTGNPVSSIILLSVLLASFVMLFVYRRKVDN